MSDDVTTVENLIEFSADDDASSPPTASFSSSMFASTTSIPLVPIPYTDGRESLENNPFDCVQKQANRPDDPFESLSREASYQPYHSESSVAVSQAEVRTANLLWMSDDSIKVEDDNPPPVHAPALQFSQLQVPSSRFGGEAISSVSSIGSMVSSLCDDSAFTSRNESSKTVNKAFITDNTISSLSDDNKTQSLMNRGFVGSCSSFDVSGSSGNSTPEYRGPAPDNSDSSGKGRSQKVVDARKRLLKLSLSNSTTNSPLTRRVPEDENSSPLSSVFSEPENAANNFSTRFAFDMANDSCDDLMSIKPNWIDSETDIDSDLEMMRIPILEEIPSPVVSSKPMPWEETVDVQPTAGLTIGKNSPDLEALKEKVQQHRAESSNNHEIGALIENLKIVIKDCASETKKTEANNLLESLSKLMSDKTAGGDTEKTDTLTPPPQPIVRQGTFDIDLKENEEREQHEEMYKQEQQPCTESNISSGTHSLHSPEPDQTEVSEIVEQIGRLLGNQNVNVVQANLSNTSGVGIPNPTYIVVMNTPIPHKQRPSIAPSNYKNDGSPELTQSQVRRRSQSLSIHDKESQFTAMLPPTPARNDCKTPARSPMVRRNSFSSATPRTPCIQPNRRSIYANTTTETITKPSQMPRRSSALETHHEKQQHVAQPSHPSMSIGSISFNAKKLKFKQSTESIVKASGPLKATVPVKKVAPMIITTNVDSPIEDLNKFKSVTSTPNVQLASTKTYPNACSTPMVETSPIKRSMPAKSRYSFVAATPTSKQSNLAPSTSQARRRTMTEMRSPRKVGEKANSSGISKPAVRTVKLPQNFSKTLNKMAPTTSRGVLRLAKPAAAASCPADKNKENKMPRSGR